MHLMHFVALKDSWNKIYMMTTTKPRFTCGIKMANKPSYAWINGS